MNQAKSCTASKTILSRIFLGAVFLALAVFLSATNSQAQSTSGRVRGTVTDASGGSVSGAALTLQNTATNVTREAVTGSNGEYNFLEVPVGAYQVELNQQGFKKYVHRDITVDLNAVVTVDIVLQVGGSS